jgi:exonuclease SbcD
MKFIHFSDTHIGVDTLGSLDPTTGINRRVLDYLDMLDSIVDFAVDENVDLVLFTGDAFHVNSPHPTYLNEFSRRIVKMREQCPVVLLVGNHDTSPRATASAIDIYASLQMDGIVVGNKLELHVIDTKAGPVQVVTVPYPNRSLLRNSVVGVDKGTISSLLRKQLTWSLHDVSVSINKTIPCLMAGHFSVDIGVKGSETDYVLGVNAELCLDDIADPLYDYVALGHIHKYQNLTAGMSDVPPVVYAGSIERVSFNEQNEAKGFVLGEIVDKKTTWEFIELEARPYKTVEVVCENGNATKKILAKISKMDLRGAVVRYVVSLPEEYTSSIDDFTIQLAFEEAGVFAVGARKVNVVRAASPNNRSEGFNVGSNPIELLSKYFQLHQIDKSDIKQLMVLAKEIMSEV